MNIDEDISEDFPNDGKIYLNNASVSLTPLSAIRSMTDFLVSYSAMGPDSIDSEPFIDNKLNKTRKVIAEIIKCQPDEIVLTQSTTDGINAVSQGMAFKNNANIIIRGLGHEHHANYYPWLRLADKIKIKNLEIDKNGLFEIKQLEGMIDENTNLVALSHALYNTGAILPVEEIGELLEKKNIPYFLDAAQTIGCIGDFDVSKTKCNFMSFNGSKWLCGPMGTGLFFCRRDSSKMLEPLTIGGESAMIYDDSKLAFKEMPAKFQTGFRNYVGIVGLEASANYLLRYGMDNIRKKVMKLANQMRSELSKLQGITIYGPESEDERTSIVSFNLEGKEPEYVVEKLEKQKIVLAVREIMEKKIVRASPHFFNTESQIEKTVYAIKNL